MCVYCVCCVSVYKTNKTKCVYVRVTRGDGQCRGLLCPVAWQLISGSELPRWPRLLCCCRLPQRCRACSTVSQIAEQLKALATGLPASNGAGAAAADGGARPAADTGAATAALAEEVVGVVRRLGRLESELGTVAGHTAALDKALGSVLEAVRGLGAAPAPAPAGEEAQAEADQAAGNANANVAVAGFSSSASSVEVAALGAKVQLLEEVLESRLGGLREEVRAAIDTATGVAAGGGGGGGGGGLGMSLASASDLAALDGRVAALHTAASNMRNRLLAVQEYVDSTQVGRGEQAGSAWGVGVGTGERKGVAVAVDGNARGRAWQGCGSAVSAPSCTDARTRRAWGSPPAA